MANWFAKIKESVLKFFGVSTESTKLVDKKEEVPEIEIAKQPGLNCPECGTRLIITMDALLNYEPVNCHGCGLELTIDQEKSKSSIESLRKLKTGLNEAESVKKRGQL